MPKNRLIIVAGMHRAGTSALTGTLEALGVKLGASLATAHEGINDRGYKEDIEIIKLHEDMLWSLHSSWDSIFPLALGELGPELRSAADTAIDNLLKDYFSHASLYGLKDPRICLFLPLWLDSCERLGIEPLVVIPTRNPISVARSLHTRDGINLYRAQLLWIKYYLDSERHSRPYKRIFITYEELLTNFDAVINRLISSLDLVVSAAMRKEAAEFVSPALNRSQKREDKEKSENWITKDSLKLYNTMQESHSFNDENLVSEFDTLAESYSAYINGLDPVLVDQCNHAISHAVEFRRYWRDAINSRAVRAANLFKNLRPGK